MEEPDDPSPYGGGVLQATTSDTELLEAEGKEPADSRRGEAQEHKAGFGAEHWALRRLEPQALDALEQELSDALNLPSEGLSGSRWEEVRSWLEAAIMDAKSEDDLGAKRRLRQMVVTGVTKAQRNVKLWREMNALRSVVEEAARSKPPVRKVREAYVALHLLEQRQEEEQGEEEDVEQDEGVGELELERAAKASKLPTSPGYSGGEGRLFGARELRRLSHDSIWLLVNSACGSPAAHQKLLYLCLVKARELYNHGKGSVSLEVKQRLKRAACSGKVDSVLTLLKIAHEGRAGSSSSRGGSAEGGSSHVVASGGKGGGASSSDEKSVSEDLEWAKSPPSDMVSRSASHWWSSDEQQPAADGGQAGDGVDDDFMTLRPPAVEQSFTCYLSSRILRQPVTLPCGHSFSRAALEAHFRAEDEGKDGDAAMGGEDTFTRGQLSAGPDNGPSQPPSSSTSTTKRRVCPMPGCGQGFPDGPLSVNRALDEIISRYFPVHEEMAVRLPTSPRTRATVASTTRGGDAFEALREIGFSDERIAQELARQPGGGDASSPASLYAAVRSLLRDTSPVPALGSGGGVAWEPALSHSDLRRLNLDTTSCLIEALGKLEPKASRAARRSVFELLGRVDWVYRDGEGTISRGTRKRLQQAVIEGCGKQVDTILRFLGAPDLPSEVDVEVVLQDQLTGIVLVDPVTLGCGHTFGKAALLEYMRRRPQADRRCPLCNWAIPSDLQLQIDPLVSYILARSFDDKVKADLDSLEDALSTTPLVVTVLKSYTHNTEVLLKALAVLQQWARGGAENLSVLNFFDVVEPVLALLRGSLRFHEQVAMRALRTLVTLSDDDASTLVMAQAGALSALLSLNAATSSATSPHTAGWADETRREVQRAVAWLVTRMLLLLSPDTLASVLNLSVLDGHGQASGGVGLLQDRLVAILEHGLLQPSSSDGDVDPLSLLSSLAKVAGPSWYSEAQFDAVAATMEQQLQHDWDRASSDAGLWAVLVKFLERAFDATGGIKEASLAKAMARSPTLPTLERLMEKGPPPANDSSSSEQPPSSSSQLVVSSQQQQRPPPPMFFVKHSGCSLDETATKVSATLGGGAGAEYGFGAYALGTRIPAGHAGSWEVTLTTEQHQDQDPMWVSEEFVVLGICTTPSLSPDWTFYAKDDNPVSGINCQTGQVLVWGRGHAHYPPMAPGDTMRLGVDLRGAKHYLVLHKFTPSDPDRLLFRIQLPDRIKAAYPAVIIFNRLSYTGRAYTAELTMARCPPDFQFSRWMASAELQERKRNGGDRSSRSSGSSSSSSSSTPLKLREPLPRAFTQQGDVVTRTCHLGPGLQRVCGRESCSLARKGVHTFLFRRRAGGFASVGLTDGMFDAYPPLPPSAGFHLEYECSGSLRLYSRSGLVMEKRVPGFSLGGSRGGEEEEVKVEVTVSRRFDDDALASLHVSVSKGSQLLWGEALHTLSPLGTIRPFVGLTCENDSISASYSHQSPEAETQSLWLAQCLTALRTLHGRGPESPTRRPSFRESQLSDHLSFLEQVLSSSGCCEAEVLGCLRLLHTKLEQRQLLRHAGPPPESPMMLPLWSLFRALKAFPPLPAHTMAVPSLSADNHQLRDEDEATTEEALARHRQDQRAELAELAWSVVQQLVEEEGLLGLLVDAGVVSWSLQSLEVLDECGVDGSPHMASAQRAMGSVLAVLLAVARSPAVHTQHALASQLSRLLACLLPLKDLKELEDEAASGSAWSAARISAGDVVVDIYLSLLRASLALPSQAREALLTARHVDRLLPFLLHRFNSQGQDPEVALAMAGIMASGDEHSCELAIFEPSVMGQPRNLPRRPTAPLPHEEEEQGGVDEEEEEEKLSEAEEEQLLAAEEALQDALLSSAPSCWTEFSPAHWGPWRAERWEEALWAALVAKDDIWTLRILAGAQRWRHISLRPCFITSRGPWRGVLSEEQLPCTVLEAAALLDHGQQQTDRAGRALRLKCMEKLLKIAGEAAALSSSTSSSNRKSSSSSRCRGVLGSSSSLRAVEQAAQLQELARCESGRVLCEKADHTMAEFVVDAEACAARHGLRPGQRVRSRRFLSSFGTVVGMSDEGRLWVHWDEDAGASLRDDDYQYIDLEPMADGPSEAPCHRTANSSGLWPVFAKAHLLEAEDEVDCNYQTLREGSRVTRGPTWHRNNDDGFAGNLGTVIRRNGDEVTVRWDGTSSESSRTYRYSTGVGSAHDVAWVFSVEETVRAGTPLEVVRGPHWRFGNQDGGFHNSGRIVAVKGAFMVVAWNGQEEEEEVEEVKDAVASEEAGPAAEHAPSSSSSRRPKLHGYWYGDHYREVEVLLRGCERLSLVDNRKEQRMDRRARLMECLLAMVGPRGTGESAMLAMRVIANLAATPLPPIAYELVYTWQVPGQLIWPAMARFPQAREAAARALLALYVAGREPLHRLLLSGDDGPRLVQAFVDGIILSDDAGLRAVGVAGLRQVLRSVQDGGRAAGAGSRSALAQRVEELLQQAMAGQAEVEALLTGVLAALEPSSKSSSKSGSVDLHAVRAGVALLEALCRSHPYRDALMRLRQRLLHRLQQLRCYDESSPVLGPAVVLLVNELGLSVQDSAVRGLLEQVDSAAVFRQLQPFHLLRAPGGPRAWPVRQLRHILRASAMVLSSVLTSAGGEDALAEVVVVEEVVDLYLAVLDAATAPLAEWAPAVAAALDGLRLLEGQLSVMHDELVRRGLPATLRRLVLSLRSEASTVGPLLPTALFTLLEVMTARHSGEGPAGAMADEALALRPEALEVSSGSRDKRHMADGHPSTCWVSQDRVQFPGVVIDRRAGASTSRAIRRPESTGHSITIRLPTPVLPQLRTSTSSGSLAGPPSPTSTSSTSSSSSSRLRRPSGGRSSPRESTSQLLLPPRADDGFLLSSPASTTSDVVCDGAAHPGGASGEWCKLQMRRGMYGNYTPAEFWVLAQIGPDRFALIKKHSLKDSRAGSWETILDRRELEEAAAAAMGPSSGGGVIESIRVEIYRNVNMGNNSKVNGLRFVAGEPEEGPMLEPEPIVAFMRAYKGSAHHWLAPALSVLNRVSHDGAFDLLRVRKDAAAASSSEGSTATTPTTSSSLMGLRVAPPPGPSETSQLVHVGSFVRCRWSKSNGMHPAVVTAVHPNRTYDVHYHDGDRDFGRPRHAIEALEEMRDTGRAQVFLDEVMRRVRQLHAYSFFDPKTTSPEESRAASSASLSSNRPRALHLGDLSRRSPHESSAAHAFGREPAPPSEPRSSSSNGPRSTSTSTSMAGEPLLMRPSHLSSSPSVSGSSSSVGIGSSRDSRPSGRTASQRLGMGLQDSMLREATRLRECLQEAQRLLLEGGGEEDEAARAQIEEQISLYTRMMQEQERRLLDLMAAEDSRAFQRSSSAAAHSPVLSTEGGASPMNGEEEEEGVDEELDDGEGGRM